MRLRLEERKVGTCTRYVSPLSASQGRKILFSWHSFFKKENRTGIFKRLWRDKKTKQMSCWSRPVPVDIVFVLVWFAAVLRWVYLCSPVIRPRGPRRPANILCFLFVPELNSGGLDKRFCTILEQRSYSTFFFEKSCKSSVGNTIARSSIVSARCRPNQRRNTT